jgi:hypothetical protein
MIRSWLSAQCLSMAIRLMFWASRIIQANDVTLRVYETPQRWTSDVTVKGNWKQ